MTGYLADSVEDQQIQGPSARFTYRRLGPRGGVPLVLLHRFRGTIDFWDPKFIDQLALGHDVIVFDNVGIGYSSGEPRDSVEGFADGAAEFIEALGLSQVDLLGWSLGGVTAQRVALRHPTLVRKLIVAGSGPGRVPDQPPMNEEVLRIMAKPDADAEDLLFLFYPQDETARTSGLGHLTNISARLAKGGPRVSDAAVLGQFKATEKALALPFEEVRKNLESIKQPVLYANGVHDVMIPAVSSYVAVQHLESATLLLYSDAGHGFLFQKSDEFVIAVNNFLST